MERLRAVIGFGLAVLSLGAIAWCAVTAQPVPPPASPPWPAETDSWDVSAPRAGPAVERDREALTEVTVAPASAADLAGVPEGRLDERLRQVRVTIVHRLRMDAADSLAGTLRQGAEFPRGMRRFTDDGFGAVKVNGTVLAPAGRLPPLLTTAGGRTTVRFTVTLLRQVRPEELLRLDFNAPTARPLLVVYRKVTLRPGEWTVLRATSIEPDREEPERLEFTVGLYPVSVTLAPDAYGFPDVREEDDFSWATALGVLTAIVLAVLLLRALGGRWWRRRPNRELAAGLGLAAPVILLVAVAEEFTLLAYLMLFVGLPLLALRHAVQVLPSGPQWTPRDALGATGVGVLLAVGMLSWSYRYGQLPGDTLVTGTAVAAAAAAGSAMVLSADLGVRAVVVRLTAFAAGSAVALLALVLWARALATQVYPPDSVRLLLAFCWALLPVAAVAVAVKQWTRGAVVVAVVVSLLVQGWPTEWLDAGSWSRALPEQAVPRIGELELTPLVRGVMGLLLLGFLLLVLRLRRLGAALGATRDSAAESTMIVCLMVAYLAPQGSATLGDINVPLPMLSITALIAWVTARWLLADPHPSVVEPGDQEEHRELIRAALHRRLLLGFEQELYRTGRGRLGAGELTMAEFDRQREAVDTALRGHGSHPETAFATAAGCSPWHNGVHGFIVSLLLSLPFLIVFGVPIGADLSSFVFEARSVIALPAFGFLFGYFYPRIRGTQPMTKALNLMAAALATELSGYVAALAEPDLGAMDKVQVVAIIVGKVALVSIGLGLYWEWRIMHLAGEPWARVRNIRSLRSLATPLLAIMIAAITTAATSAAGQTVDRILRGDETSQQP
ncbi:hypothetical protein OUY22_30140 [Nonomuraea sp. MCN248]|uniref:ABC transporter permease n=1 Tax=Nonomuraea corallina TaxID=2989783 RepID=A0ABT4SKE5_9ACTN|nr:hypothetical protein [Nonomuraea corallina]MDA0637689.1 hypothetical protein [Nonomuraea corallina]